MFSFAYFPGVWVLKSDVSEPSIGSISFFLHLSMKMEPIEGSETSVFRTQTAGNYLKENMLHKEQGESLKSRILLVNWGRYLLDFRLEYVSPIRFDAFFAQSAHSENIMGGLT
jgi:hypothetical protein